ncbi:MAG: hypothetical protein EKK40_07675 [Bradyrhizobiaceae bacterium]|nr:MAG: hypothetical protein EKK40_07675 [Bradyrhizobiaceae bacterium]
MNAIRAAHPKLHVEIAHVEIADVEITHVETAHVFKKPDMRGIFLSVQKKRSGSLNVSLNRRHPVWPMNGG